jgi:hypothetical protein
VLRASLACLIYWCAVLSVLPQSSTRPASERRFSERLNVILKEDPGFLRNVRSQRGFPPEMESLKWLLGSWKASGKRYQTSSTPETPVADMGSVINKTVSDSSWIWSLNTREGTGVLMPYIGYDRPSKRYLLDTCGGAGVYGVLTSPGPKGESITFEGDATIMGILIDLRQTFTKTKPSEFEIFNEERMADGTWVPIDHYDFTKQN